MKCPIWRLILGSLLVLTLSLPLRALDPATRISQYGHSIWRLQDGAFSSAPTAVAQTNDGYIWIGTATELLRFDGVRFTHWAPPGWDQISSPQINVLHASSDGTLWIGTPSSIAAWRDGKLTVISVEGYANDITEDHLGRIWVAISRSHRHTPLCEVFPGKAHCFGAVDGIPFAYGGSLAVDGDGNLVATSASQVIRWSPERGLVSSYTFEELKQNEGLHGISTLFEDGRGTSLVGIGFAGKGMGLQQLQHGSASMFTAGSFVGSSLDPQSLLRDREGKLWVGTFTTGLYRVTNASTEHFAAQDGLSGDSVRNFLEDKEGNLWVVTDGGVDCFHDLKVLSLSSREGLPPGFVDSILAAKDGSVLVLSHSALHVLKNGSTTTFDAEHGLPGNGVTALMEDALGRFWMGVANELVIFDGHRFQQVKRADGKPLGVVYSLALDVDGSMWASVMGAPPELVHIVNGNAEVVLKTDKLVLLASDGRPGVWLSDKAKLGHYSEGKVEWVPSDGRHGTSTMIVGSDGAVYLDGTTGVWGERNGKAQMLNQSNGLPCSAVDGMAFSAKGSLVLRSSCGLIVIDQENLETWWHNPRASIPFRLLDSYDGAHLSHAVFSPQMSLAPDGKLWVANQGGIQVFDPDRLSRNLLVPPVHIEEVIADHLRVEQGAGLMLPPLTRDLEIHYTALSLSAPQKVRFRYMLENRDETWQDPGTRRTAFYQDLKPGRYRFRVLASNNDGLWNSSGDTLEFSVRPAWFQTLWFRILSIAVALALIWATYALRVRSIANAITARFDERLDERTRMALELHDTFLQTVQGSKMVADDALDPASDEVRMRNALERLSLWLGQAVVEGRAALHALRTSTTERNHLAEFLDRSAKEHCQRTSISVALTVIGDAVDVHPIVRDEVARIAEEAIRNACLHSNGSQLSVELRYARDLILSIRDNGVGINPEIIDFGKVGHFGLIGMRERSARIRARITITSTLNAGTQILLNVPGDVVYRRERKTFFGKLREATSWGSRLNPKNPKKTGANDVANE